MAQKNVLCVCMYMCTYIYAYMHAQKNINSTVYKSDYSIYFFLLVNNSYV